jgi:transcriptional regulator GlxA family with amidase domain
LRDVQDWMTDHLDDDLSVERLARRAAMSPRNFARSFAREVGVTPARYVEDLRVEAARRLLETTARPVEEVAAACGFGTAETMRRTFVRRLHVSPSDYRKRFSDLRKETA